MFKRNPVYLLLLLTGCGDGVVRYTPPPEPAASTPAESDRSPAPADRSKRAAEPGTTTAPAESVADPGSREPPAAEPPAAEPPAAEPPAAKPPAAEPPAAKPPAVKPPAVKPPAVKPPAAKPPAAKPPAGGSDRPATGAAVLSWSRPRVNEDGSELGDLEGFKIIYGNRPDRLEKVIRVGNVTRHRVDLPPGKYYFAVIAVDSRGNESRPSAVVSKVVTP